MTVKLKRIQEAPAAGDGTRVLVDRLWPRGISEAKAAVDEWLQDAAPSQTLRNWFAHDPRRWQEFQKRYFQELDGKPEVVDRLQELERPRGILTLLYGARDPDRNNAVALRHYLERLPKSKSGRRESSRPRVSP